MFIPGILSIGVGEGLGEGLLGGIGIFM